MEHKSKEEILRRVVPNNCFWEDYFDNVPRHYIETSMDQYAQQVAISFAEWIDKGWESVRLGEYQGKYSGEIKTTAELFTLFLTHKSI